MASLVTNRGHLSPVDVETVLCPVCERTNQPRYDAGSDWCIDCTDEILGEQAKMMLDRKQAREYIDSTSKPLRLVQ